MKFNENIIDRFKNELIDFTDCEENGKIYEKSSMKKHGVVYNNGKYLLKFMEKNIARHYNYREHNSETYFNSIYSEYISCHIGKMIGLNIQDTFIGYEKIINQNKEIEYIPCVACKDFCKDDEILLSFEEIFQRTNRKAPYSYNKNKFYDILEVINKQSFIDKQQLKEWFLDMFIFDSFIGNFDRNLNNFGIIEHTKDKTYRLAPIFDCASSLHPKASRETIDQINNSFKELNPKETLEKQTFKKPSSYFTNDSNEKIKYYEFLITNGFYGDLDIAQAICRVAPNIIDIVNNYNLHILLADMTGIIPDDRLNVIRTELSYKAKYMMSPMLDIANNIIDLHNRNNKLNNCLNEYRYITNDNNILISNINNTLDQYYIIDSIRNNLPLTIQEKYEYLTEDYVYSAIDQFIYSLLIEENVNSIKNLLTSNNVDPIYIHHFNTVIAVTKGTTKSDI